MFTLLELNPVATEESCRRAVCKIRQAGMFIEGFNASPPGYIVSGYKEGFKLSSIVGVRDHPHALEELDVIKI